MPEDIVALENFLTHLRHHLQGWQSKVDADFSKEAYDIEMGALLVDPVYSKFHLASADYILIRLMGRMSVSIGRRLGELYDKIPRLAAQARYRLDREKVVVKFDGLELDVALTLADLSAGDSRHLIQTCRKHLNIQLKRFKGLATEIRYNFNPNDSARLRKDKHLGEVLQAEGYSPLYLVFAENSPRLGDAVASLRRGGWQFLVGKPALAFMADLVGFDISNVLDRPEVSREIQRQIQALMESIRKSYAYQQANL
jgi:hypothetical protein